MSSTLNWWRGEVDWSTPAGKLLRSFAASLPPGREYRFTLYGSAPLQLTLDPEFLSADIDLFSDGDEDISALIAAAGFGSASGGLYLESGFELSFRTSPRWRTRSRQARVENAVVTIPHPIDILIGKLDRFALKDLQAFERVIQITGHPTKEEFLVELQNAVDLFRPGFEEESVNRYPENTIRLWKEVFGSELDVRLEIVAPALARRRAGYGETPPPYKKVLGE